MVFCEFYFHLFTNFIFIYEKKRAYNFSDSNIFDIPILSKWVISNPEVYPVRLPVTSDENKSNER